MKLVNTKNSIKNKFDAATQLGYKNPIYQLRFTL